MRVTFTGEVFICRCTFDEREIPKHSGFRWDNSFRHWYTPHPSVAARLKNYCDEKAKSEISKVVLETKPWTAALTVPKNETLKHFQEKAVRFALERNRAYLALDPGLGKTPIAAIISATLWKTRPVGVIYICPPFLTRNTEAEFNRFAPGMRVVRFPSGVKSITETVTIVPDSLISRELVQNGIKSMTDFCRERNIESILFVDEAHRFKNGNARRTKALFGFKRRESDRVVGIASQFDRVIYLSGTPMPNRPVELYPILSHSAPETIDNMDYFRFGIRYCNAHETQFGWDFSGASNVAELASRVMGKFMLRMKKAEVMTELPEKTEELVLLEQDMPAKLSAVDSKILRDYSPEDLMSGQIKMKLGNDTLHLATYRRELGLAKLESSLEYIKYLLEETDEAVLIFAIHKEVIQKLAQSLYKFEPLVITGETEMAKRHDIVKEFQHIPGKRVFIGNIQAAGTGLTLTKATRVVFVEFSWTPADNEQASDRAHRIGQTENVLVQYLVFKDSVDRSVMETVLRKRKVTALV